MGLEQTAISPTYPGLIIQAPRPLARALQERVIANRGHAGDNIVVKAILNNPAIKSVLDVGAGSGRFLTAILEGRPDVRMVALEFDVELGQDLARNFPEVEVLNSSALDALPISDPVDAAVLVNTAHEVCIAETAQERKQLFQLLIRNMKRVLNPAGEIIMFDGIMPENDGLSVTVTPVNNTADQTLATFMQTYEADRVDFHANGHGVASYEGTVADLSKFQTKYGYIGQSVWKGEARQLYPFIKLSEMKEILEIEGFEITKSAYPVDRTGVDRFLEAYNVVMNNGNGEAVQLNKDNFPQTQVYIRAKLVNI